MVLPNDIIAKLRSDIIEKMFQMGYSLDGERKLPEMVFGDGCCLEFFRPESPKITVIIEKGK